MASKQSKPSKFYWFVFADGYSTCCAGLSGQERRALEREHGKLAERKPA